MLFEELYDSLIRLHHHDAGNTINKGQPILAQPDASLERDALKSGNESSDAGCHQRSAHTELPPPPSAESPANRRTSNSIQESTVISGE
jgi:hypothetical protein